MVLLLELKVHWHVVTNSTHIDNDMLNLDQLYAIIMVSSERDVMLPVGFEMGIATLLSTTYIVTSSTYVVVAPTQGVAIECPLTCCYKQYLY